MTEKPSRLPPDVFFVDKKTTLSLQAQLISSIVSFILQEHIPDGTRLPSSRKLAKFLGISRLTVTLAYNELMAQNYLVAVPRSGYVVSPDAPKRRVLADKTSPHQGKVDWSKWLQADRVRRRQIIKPRTWSSFPYPFIYGQIDRKLFNHSAWRECARRAMGIRDYEILAGDWATDDDPMLVDYIRTRTLPRRGIEANPDEILITMGAQNALWIAIDILKHTGLDAAYEDPGYPDLPEMLRFSGVQAHPVPIDKEGLRPDRIPDKTGMVFVTPSHHVPTGVTMPMERRRALLDKAEREDFLVIEDDYEFEMSFLKPPSPALKSMDRFGRVIYVGSFSKSIFPGLRLGYMVAPAPFITQARALRAIMLRHPPGHTQRTTAYFLGQGYYDALIVNTRDAMRVRREVLQEEVLKSGLTIAGAAPHGGTSLWIRGPDGLDSNDLSRALVEMGVLIEPGTPFFAIAPVPCPWFRMGYSCIDKNAIPEGVRRITECINLMR